MLVNFNAYASYVTESLYQWDINQTLVVEGLMLSIAPEIHFSNANMDRAIVRQSTLTDGAISARIPNSLLQEALTIKAYIGRYVNGEYRTIETVEIPVIARPRPLDYTFEDTDGEIYSFNQLENKLVNSNNRITQIENKLREDGFDDNGSGSGLDFVNIIGGLQGTLTEYEYGLLNVGINYIRYVDGDNIYYCYLSENSKAQKTYTSGGFTEGGVTKYLKIVVHSNYQWYKTTSTYKGFTTPTAADNGKVLSVVNGFAQWITPKGYVLTAEDKEEIVNMVIAALGGTVELIEFTIDDFDSLKTYNATPGMTWGEWVDSQYNTDGYYFGENGQCVYPNGDFSTCVKTEADVELTEDTLIVADATYRVSSC